MLRNWRGVALIAIALLACGPDKAVEPSVSPEPAIIVSAPIPRASLPGGTDSSGSVVFVSAMPQALPGAVQALIRGADGQSVTAGIVDGGFDPVAVGAASGEVVTVTLTDGSGATRSEELAVRTRRPPRVIRTSPAPRRTDVPLNVVVRVVFSAPVDLESARAGILLTTGEGVLVPGTVEAAGVAAVDYVVTAGTLAPETTYRLEVTTGVRDLLGQPLAEPVSFEFRTGTTTVEEPPLAPSALELEVAPARIILVQGGRGQADIKIARGEAFSGAVSLSASSSAGVTVTFSATLIDSGSNTATASVAVDATVTTGIKTIVISAVGDGMRAATAQATLTIVVTAGSVSLTIAPTRIDLVQGGHAAQVEATITRGGSFTGPVRLLVTGTPSGVVAGYWFHQRRLHHGDAGFLGACDVPARSQDGRDQRCRRRRHDRDRRHWSSTSRLRPGRSP